MEMRWRYGRNGRWGPIMNIYSARCSAGVWGTAKLIDNGANPAHNPEVAMDGKGNAIALWEQFDGAYFSIYSNRYSAGGWGTAKLIETAAGDALDSQIAMDSNGNAVAVWKQSDVGTSYGSEGYSIYSARCSAGVWGTAKVIDTGVGSSYCPQIAMDGKGTAIAVWMHFGLPTDNNIYVNRYSAGAWGTPKAIKTGAGAAYDPQIAMDGKGTAIAVWQQYDGAHVSIYSSRYSAGVWTRANVIETATVEAATPQIAMDSYGNAVAVWQQYDGAHYSIYANRYSAGAWGKAKPIETGAGDAYDPQVAMDGKGCAEVVWVPEGWFRSELHRCQPVLGRRLGEGQHDRDRYWRRQHPSGGDVRLWQGGGDLASGWCDGLRHIRGVNDADTFEVTKPSNKAGSTTGRSISADSHRHRTGVSDDPENTMDNNVDAMAS